MKPQLNRSATALLALFAAVTLTMSGCASSPSTEPDDSKPAAQEAAPKPDTPAAPISLAEVADSGKEAAAKACTALLESPVAITKKLGLSSEEVLDEQGSGSSHPWVSASTGNYGNEGDQRVLACEFKGYMESGRIYVNFGLNSPEGENPFCNGSNPCVTSADKERTITLINQSDDPKNADLNMDALAELLDRFSR